MATSIWCSFSNVLADVTSVLANFVTYGRLALAWGSRIGVFSIALITVGCIAFILKSVQVRSCSVIGCRETDARGLPTQHTPAKAAAVTIYNVGQVTIVDDANDSSQLVRFLGREKKSNTAQILINGPSAKLKAVSHFRLFVLF